MKKLHIITPVKDSIELSLGTIRAVMAADYAVPYDYTVFNDNSTPENTEKLRKASEELGFKLINIADITDHPSPNYLLVLQVSQERALAEDAALAIVESDVLVEKHTLQELFDGAAAHSDCGMAAAVTVDEQGITNYPYLFAKDLPKGVHAVKKHLSFCCSLLTPAYMRTFDFHTLDPEKNWHDVTISHQSLKNGFSNYLFTELPVIHRPHGSRPWKQLKYTNPLKYYWRKFTKGLDKI